MEVHISIMSKSQKPTHDCCFKAPDLYANILGITERINSGGNYARSNDLVANRKEKF